MCRYGKHPVCICGSKRHHPSVEPKGVQLSVRSSGPWMAAADNSASLHRQLDGKVSLTFQYFAFTMLGCGQSRLSQVATPGEQRRSGERQPSLCTLYLHSLAADPQAGLWRRFQTLGHPPSFACIPDVGIQIQTTCRDCQSFTSNPAVFTQP